MSKGRFISIEGGDGTGKSTLAKSLVQALATRGIESVLTREPGGSAGGEAIRELIMTGGHGAGWSARTETLLFAAARSDHIEQVIAPELARGAWVICDRFVDSMYAYQFGAGELDQETAKLLEKLVSVSIMPDLTLLLDMAVDGEAGKTLMRRRASSGPDPFEQRSSVYHSKVRQAFLALAQAEPERIMLLNAEHSPEDVSQEALCLLAERLGFPE